MEEEIKKEYQETNISGLWYKNLYESLERMQTYEKICRDGSIDISEWLQIPPARIPEIQFQFLRRLITEMAMLIINAKPKLNKSFFVKSKIHLNMMKQKVDLHPEEIFYSIINQQSHTTNYVLTEEYYKLLNTLSSIYEKVVTELAEVLFGQAPERSGGMEKTKTPALIR